MLPKSFLIILLSACTSVQAQLSADTVAMIDKLMNRYADSIPGAQLAISRNGQVIYAAARGLADLEHNVPLTKTSKIEAGSVSKQFTAAAILLLQQQGKLSTEDDVRKYIPELPDYGKTIRIRHLMQHTSGLKDWGSIAELSGWPRTTKAYNNDDALAIIIRQKTLNNDPGDEYIYSNSGYTLLTHIVQRVSGMSHADFTKQYLLEPAGMKHTEWRNNFSRVVKDRAIAYEKNGDDYYMNMPFEDTYGHGALLTTAEDLLAWNEFYLGARLGADLLKTQLQTNSLNNGKPNLYAAGLNVIKVNGWRTISHSGATAGYRANLEYFPDLGISVAWLSNNANGVSGVPGAIRELFVKDTVKRTTVTEKASPVDIKTFAPYLGAYRNEKMGGGFRVWMTDTSLMSTPNGRMIPVSDRIATMGRARIIFQARPRSLQFITPSGDTLVFTGVDTARTTATALREYEGMYESEETDAAVQLFEKNGKLYSRVRNSETELTPVYKDGFSIPAGDVFFERNKQGRITRLLVSISRARKVEYKKVK